MKIPTFSETLDRLWKTTETRYDLLLLGRATDGAEVEISLEELKDYMEILGTTQEGKSKFIEYLVRELIKRLSDPKTATGICLFDASVGGDTLYKILRYCAEIGFYKVLVIDPSHRYGLNKVVPINPFHYEPSLIEKSVENIMDVCRNLFAVKDPAFQAIINHHLPALLSVLHHAGLTLHEATFFNTYDDLLFFKRREQIFEKLDSLDDVQKNRVRNHRVHLESQLRNSQTFKELGSTVRRLTPLLNNSTLDLMLGSKRGIDFDKLISDNWLILVNLDVGGEFGVMQSRMLASVIINEIVFSIRRLKENGWKRKYYLFLDEAALFATMKIANILELQSKMGIRFIFSHQHFGQFEDPRILSAIKTQTKTKVAFYIADPEERLKVVKMMYGGDLSDREVNFNLSSQRKQNAVMRFSKQASQIVRTPDCPDAKPKNFDLYLQKLLNKPWYKHPGDILKEYNERFSGENPLRPESGASPDRKPARTNDRHKVRNRDESPRTARNKKTGEKEANRNWDTLFLEPPEDKGDK